MNRVCSYMNVDPSKISLRFYDEGTDVVVRDRSRSTAGLFIDHNDFFEIWIESKQIGDPLALVATLAHEVGHVRLLGENRVSPETPDHELLTDLITVFFGLGVFTANSTIRETNWHEGNYSGWSMSKLGYMSMPMHGVAHALLARSRGESDPSWSKYLRNDVRAVFRDSMRRFETLPPMLQPPAFDALFINQYASQRLGAGTTEPEASEQESELDTEEDSFTCHYCGEPVSAADAICRQSKIQSMRMPKSLQKKRRWSKRIANLQVASSLLVQFSYWLS